ncbi:MAG TPA: flagellar basal body-associated FliL family protein [Burkholderiales bacterium]|nr:flagellar basal body-associated FliL family protein [Burkholderiales bacterium]
MATPPKAAPPPEAAPAPAPAPKKRGKLMLMISLGVLVLAGGGGGAWYMLSRGDTDPPAIKVKATVFLGLEVFTVNLISRESLPQYLQTAITLKLPEDYATIVKARMPEVRNRILMVLSSKSVKELLLPDGKQKLALEIADAVKTMIAPPVAAAPAPPAPAASVMGEAQAAAVGEGPPAAAGDVPAAPPADTQAAQVAEGAGPAPDTPPPQPKAQSASNIEVLFTSFIIQ